MRREKEVVYEYENERWSERRNERWCLRMRVREIQVQLMRSPHTHTNTHLPPISPIFM